VAGCEKSLGKANRWTYEMTCIFFWIGDPDELIPTDFYVKEYPLSKWKSIGSLTPLNLTYDVTPPDLVTAVVTELAILPCTSVPVILRIKPTETGC